jgi:uncharacterized protein (TIRG00374 family)
MAAVSVYPEREQHRSPKASDGTSSPEVAKSPRRRLLRRLALVGVAAATVVFALLDARAASGAARLLGHVRLGWLGLAVAAEAASLLSFGRLRRALLCAAQVAPRRAAIVAVTLAGTALARVLPGGAASAGVWAYRQLRRRGIERSTAMWVLLVAGALSSLGLFAIVVLGIELGGDRSPSASLRWAATGLASIPLAVGVVSVILGRCPRSRLRAERVSQRLEASSRLGRRCGLAVRALWAKLRLARLGPARWLVAWLWGLGNWIFDGALLVICILALGIGLPWPGIVFAYGLSQLATSVPLTPGGLGLVEASLAGLLVAEGMAGVRALAVVVLYRGVSLLVVGALGAGAGLCLRSNPWQDPPGLVIRRVTGPQRAATGHMAPLARSVWTTGRWQAQTPTATAAEAAVRRGPIIPYGCTPSHRGASPGPDRPPSRVQLLHRLLGDRHDLVDPVSCREATAAEPDRAERPVSR